MTNSWDESTPRGPASSQIRIAAPGAQTALIELLALAAALFLITIFIGFTLVGQHGGGPIQSWDTTVGRWFLTHRGPLVPAARFVATYLDALPLAIMSVILSGVLLAWLRTPVGMMPIVAYLGAEFQVFAVRQVIHRPRPLSANWPHAGSISGVHETSFSFPSGHAVAVSPVLFALLGTLALVHHWWWPWIVAFVLALFVADTRLVLGVHWFSDVTLGVLVGSAWGIAVAAIGVHLSWADLRKLIPSRRGR